MKRLLCSGGPDNAHSIFDEPGSFNAAISEGRLKNKKNVNHGNRYERLIEKIFFAQHRAGATEVTFQRTDIGRVAKALKVPMPKNLGDLIYSFRYRTSLPKSILNTAPPGKEWIIVSAGRSAYRFELVQAARLAPNLSLTDTKVPDSTPGVIAKYALTDEQALLAKIRYNRLVDIFTGVTCYSLQSHLRTTAAKIGQVETDEIYIGIDRRGAHYVFPIQVKRGKDALGIVQIRQDLAMCREKWSNLICRPIAAQLMADDMIALFELEQDPRDDIKTVSEKHYRLVPPKEVSERDLDSYRRRPD